MCAVDSQRSIGMLIGQGHLCALLTVKGLLGCLLDRDIYVRC